MKSDFPDDSIDGSGSTAGAAEGADDRMGRAKEFVGQKYSAASGAVKDGYSTVREKVSEVDFSGVNDQVRSFVKANPGKALLISVGVGFLVGLVLRSNRDDD